MCPNRERRQQQSGERSREQKLSHSVGLLLSCGRSHPGSILASTQAGENVYALSHVVGALTEDSPIGESRRRSFVAEQRRFSSHGPTFFPRENVVFSRGETLCAKSLRVGGRRNFRNAMARRRSQEIPKSG